MFLGRPNVDEALDFERFVFGLGSPRSPPEIRQVGAFTEAEINGRAPTGVDATARSAAGLP